MATLPWPNRFEVAPAKVTKYLLDPHHSDGGPKAAFLKQFGFTAANPFDLHHALISHTQQENYFGEERGYNATKMYFHGLMFSLTRQQPHVRTVWQVDDDSTGTARFITLVPLPKLKRPEPHEEADR